MHFAIVRYFLMYVLWTLSTCIILLACIDRWISSIKAHRHYNSVPFARIVILVTTIISIISFFNVLIYFGVQKTSTLTTCYAMSGPYRIFSDRQYLFFYSFGPPFLMITKVSGRRGTAKTAGKHQCFSPTFLRRIRIPKP